MSCIMQPSSEQNIGRLTAQRTCPPAQPWAELATQQTWSSAWHPTHEGIRRQPDLTWAPVGPLLLPPPPEAPSLSTADWTSVDTLSAALLVAFPAISPFSCSSSWIRWLRFPRSCTGVSKRSGAAGFQTWVCKQ